MFTLMIIVEQTVLTLRAYLNVSSCQTHLTGHTGVIQDPGKKSAAQTKFREFPLIFLPA